MSHFYSNSPPTSVNGRSPSLKKREGEIIADDPGVSKK